jgi:asparagine synthase (glutamine-hydrolysing)
MQPFAAWPGLGSRLRSVAAPLVQRLTSPKYAGLAEYGGTLGGAYLLRRSLYMPWELPQVMDADLAREAVADLRTLPGLEEIVARQPNQRIAVSALEMSWYMRHQLLRDTDWASMAHSLEVRVPMLDLPLLRAAVPWLAAYPGLAKHRVAAALAPNLPSELLHKPKTGFTVPVRDWLMSRRPAGQERGLRGWARFIDSQALGQHT